MLFYWWPVWATGLVMAAITYFEGTRMAIVPSGTQVGRAIQGTIEVKDDKEGKKPVNIDNQTVLLVPANKGPVDSDAPLLHMSRNKNLGVIFATILVLVAVITNVPLRGLWSVVIIGLIFLFVLLFAYLELWDRIFDWVFKLQVHINLGGYLFIALGLFLAWAATMLLFDQQVYMVFTPGQVKVCLEIGGGETSYDTMGMVIQKQRDDLFRHWILGLGSGDLVVRTSGANAHEFHLPNVLFVGRKLQLIVEMQRERPVVRG
jgi:hypothetical protein